MTEAKLEGNQKATERQKLKELFVNRAFCIPTLEGRRGRENVIGKAWKVKDIFVKMELEALGYVHIWELARREQKAEQRQKDEG